MTLKDFYYSKYFENWYIKKHKITSLFWRKIVAPSFFVYKYFKAAVYTKGDTTKDPEFLWLYQRLMQDGGKDIVAKMLVTDQTMSKIIHEIEQKHEN